MGQGIGLRGLWFDWCVDFGVWGLGIRVWGLGISVGGLRVEDLLRHPDGQGELLRLVSLLLLVSPGLGFGV